MRQGMRMISLILQYEETEDREKITNEMTK